MKNAFLFLFYSLCGVIMLCSGCSAGQKAMGEKGKGRLVWSDEFDYTGLPDSSKWSYDIGDGCKLPCGCGWGNNELQFYTERRPENARVENGRLVIEVHREKMGGRDYSSARLLTKSRGDWKYGRIEVRASLPTGRGIWPAIWMLPSDRSHGNWPRSGEIDVMEFVGFQADTVYSTVHTERFNGMKNTQKSAGIWTNTPSDFHIYTLEWSPEEMVFFMDDRKINAFQNLHDGVDAWPFDRAFHLLLNVAVGGNWGGKKGVDESAFPQKMQVDYVRVYQTKSPATAQN